MSLNFDLKPFIYEALQNDASDIHFETGRYPSLRINGQIKELCHHPYLQECDMNDIKGAVLNDRTMRYFNEHMAVDSSYSDVPDCRLRVSIAKCLGGHKVVCRLIPNKIPTIEQYNMPNVFKEISLRQQGFILVAGVTGSGKSTTIAAMIEHINQNQYRHVITIEDPVEFVHEPKNSIFTRREINTHVENFSDGLRTALRQDPDVILVGEMRDLETMRSAIRAAETGHLVLATVHAGEVDDIPERIIGNFPENEQCQIRNQLANVSLAFIAQCLVRNKLGTGRFAAYEILILNNAARNLIRESQSHQLMSVMQTGRRAGMITMTESLLQLYRENKISAEELIATSTNKERAREYVLANTKDPEIDIAFPFVSDEY